MPESVPGPENIEAVIFDMDGVITDTACIHASAWKSMFDEFLKEHTDLQEGEFHPFDADSDYLLYVDGKPRYDGVKDFLESRGISLPYGDPQDDADMDTICGLGNRKNRYYLKIIDELGVKLYESSVAFVKQLKTKGISAAIISASRNAEEILRKAGVLNLFDAKVDGVDSDELQLQGKPDPAIFMEAAGRLGVNPAKAAIVEDSLAGVEAGRRGGFKLVIGVNRAEQGEELMNRGADIVVSDLSELDINLILGNLESPNYRYTDELPSAIEKIHEIFGMLREKTPAVFLDYDGTLTPIVEDPADATLTKDTRKVLNQLADHYSVAIISGRDLEDVRNMVGIGDLAYAGSHGFDIIGPGGHYKNQEMGKSFLPAFDSAEDELKLKLNDIRGVKVERKRFAIAVHYRQVSDSDIEILEQNCDDVISHYPELKKSTGKKIFEFRPNIDWDKGKAIMHLLEELYPDSKQVLPIYIGDDTTDEDAFRAIGDHGIAIAVADRNYSTSAHYILKSPQEVAEFLQDLAGFAERGAFKGAWVMSYNDYNREQEGVRETLCTLGNGYFATRGAAPESEADGIHYPGTYVNGCFNRLQTEIDGQVIENESMVNLPNWLPLLFRFDDGDWFNIENVNVIEYHQELDTHRGLLSRFIRFTDTKSRRTRVFQRRFVSMANAHLAGLETTIVAENWSGNLYIRSALEGRITNSGVTRYHQLNNRHLIPVETRDGEDEIACLTVETSQSHIRISEAMRTRIIREGKKIHIKPRLMEEPAYIAHEFTVELVEDEAVTIEKIVALYTSIDRAISESSIEACKEIRRAPGFYNLLRQHMLRWDHLWRRCHISIYDSDRASMILHLHIFHLLQTVSPHSIDRDNGVPPRGIHGEAYRGHILWDELFIFPLLNLRIPDITRSLLMYRYRRLPEARWAAKQAGHKGAMYPWQSGSDGREESQQLHLNPSSGRWVPDNSQLQRHISLAVAYNVWQYYQVTRDINFIIFYGTEMLVEIARFWASIASYNQSLDRYEIKGVMGPDEFHDAYPGAVTPGIDNNAYTNIMVVWTLSRALEVIEFLPDDLRRALEEKLLLKQEEVQRWDEISRKMRIVFHGDGIISQFEGYDKLDEFNWEKYQKKYGNIHRLDRILEAEGDTPNRYKLSKQADVLMLFYLFSADELEELFSGLDYPYDHDTIPKNIDYYLKRTSHGSTLSRVVHAWVMARSKRELSWHLFKEALESDVSDIQGGTTAEGIHLGAMAGTVDLIQRCYTGIETRGNKLRLNPYLPNDLKEMQFDILYRHHWINISIKRGKLTVSTKPGKVDPITIAIWDHSYEINAGDSIEVKI